MKTINKNTKKGQAFIAMYNRATATSIYECYASPSTAKTRAEVWCRAQMCNENGNGFRILSYNTMKFTAAWMVGDVLRVETADNSYIVR